MDVHIAFDGTDTRMFFVDWNIWLSDIFGYINKEIIKYLTDLILIIY